MPKTSAIPLMSDKTTIRVHVDRVLAIKRFIRGSAWSFEDTLRVFSSIVFYGGRSRRAQTIAWLEELLKDLKNTKKKLLDPDDGNDRLWNA